MSSPVNKVYFEDVAPGTRFKGKGPVIITRDEIIAFARQFDPQPFHLEEEAAGKSFFKQLVASGWHTACITMRMLVEGELQFEEGMIGTTGDISWTAPVKPDDALEVRGEVLETFCSRSQNSHGFVRISTETVNQHGETVQRMTARLMIRRRPVT